MNILSGPLHPRVRGKEMRISNAVLSLQKSRAAFCAWRSRVLDCALLTPGESNKEPHCLPF